MLSDETYAAESAAGWYQQLATLPLPDAAVVLDVRHAGEYEQPLTGYLDTELSDLAREMQYYEIPGWCYLSACFDILRVDANEASREALVLDEFVVTTRQGKHIPLVDPANLASFLGSRIDAVRNVRLGIAHTHTPEESDTSRPSTVRLFLLADMQRPESITRAARYAQLVKEWHARAHGEKRFSRDDYVQTILFCLNSETSRYHTTLLDTAGQVPDTAIDTILLLQTYSDNEAYLDEDTQVAQADLLLYTLLLRWPEVFLKKIDDPVEATGHIVQGAQMLPWPTYTLGIAAMEYSTRWAARWLDYGITGELLYAMNDMTKGGQDNDSLQRHMRKWLENWWQELREIVPEAFASDVSELAAFAELDTLVGTSTLARSSAKTVRQHLDTFRQQVSARYNQQSSRTLKEAIEDSDGALLDQLRWVSTQMAQQEEGEPDEQYAPYVALARLSSRVQAILALHFQEARGALPRALSQLAVVTSYTQQLEARAQQVPDIEGYREQFEAQARQADAELAKRLVMWNLPLPGAVLRSTVISLTTVLVLIVLLLVGTSRLFSPQDSVTLLSALHLSSNWALLLGLLWRALVVIALIAAEWLYLARRNRGLQSLYRQIHKALCETITFHKREVGEVIATRVALRLLERADLYARGADISPYERRLRDASRAIQEAQQQAEAQHDLAHMRVEGMAKAQSSRSGRPVAIPNRNDLLNWPRLEDAFLSAKKELQSGSANLFAEVLLRRLGTERMEEMLEHLVQQRLKGKDAPARFQAVSTLLVALLFSWKTQPPEVSELLPLLQQYTALKQIAEAEQGAPGEGTLDLQRLVRQSMLQQEREARVSSPMFLQAQERPPTTAALASWVGQQHHQVPQLAEIFASNHVIERTMPPAMQPSQVMDGLRRQGTLLGHPDEVAGDDYFYLFVTPGEMSETFLRSLNPLHETRIHRYYFPDPEKLVYLHVHRIRQFFPPSEAAKVSSM